MTALVGERGGPADLGASIMQLQLYNYYYTKFLSVVGWERERERREEVMSHDTPDSQSLLGKFQMKLIYVHVCALSWQTLYVGSHYYICIILGKFTSMLLSISVSISLSLSLSLNKFLRNFLKEFIYSLYLYFSLNKFLRSFPRPLPLSLGYDHFLYLICWRMTSTFALDYWDFVLCN